MKISTTELSEEEMRFFLHFVEEAARCINYNRYLRENFKATQFAIIYSKKEKKDKNDTEN